MKPMSTIPARKHLALALLACLLAPAAHAAPEDGIGKEIRQEMTAARKEVRTELAQARAELETENLELGNSLQFGKDNKRKTTRDESLPKAEITRKGDFLIDGKAVAIDARQRRLLLTYREQVIDIARAGIDIGERSALAALDAVDRGLFGLMFSALSGGLEQRVEKMVKDTVEPAVLQICPRLPSLLESQQQLSAAIPEFRPYATLEAADIQDCEKDVREGFAFN